MAKRMRRAHIIAVCLVFRLPPLIGVDHALDRAGRSVTAGVDFNLVELRASGRGARRAWAGLYPEGVGSRLASGLLCLATSRERARGNRGLHGDVAKHAMPWDSRTVAMTSFFVPAPHSPSPSLPSPALFRPCECGS